jgi:hypothetical protein
VVLACVLNPRLQLDIQIPDPIIDIGDDDDESGDTDDEDNHEAGEDERRRLKLHLEGMSPLDRPPTLMVNGQFA